MCVNIVTEIHAYRDVLTLRNHRYYMNVLVVGKKYTKATFIITLMVMPGARNVY